CPVALEASCRKNFRAKPATARPLASENHPAEAHSPAGWRNQPGTTPNPAAWRSDPQAPVFSAPARLPSAPWRGRSGCGRCLCSCPPTRKSSAPSQFLRASSLAFPNVLQREFVRNRSPVAKGRSLRARSPQTKRTGAQSPATWKTEQVNEQFCGAIRDQPFSIHRGKRFHQPRIAHREQRTPRQQLQIHKRERGADSHDREQIPDAYVDTGPVQRRQHNEIHV